MISARDVLSLRTGIFAHRGNSAAYPENTLPAFRSAFQLGCPMVETDLHLTADGELVLWHDERTGRNTDRDLVIEESSLAELRSLDAGFTRPAFRGMGLYMMTLNELLEEFPEGVFNIDLKSPDPMIAVRYAQVLAAHRAWERVVTGSFHGNVLRRFRRLAPACLTSMSPGEVRAAVIINRRGLRWLRPLAAILIKGRIFQVPEVHGNIRVVNRGLISSWVKSGVPVQVWTVNEPEEAKRLFRSGVRGVFTDAPETMLQALRGFDPDGESPPYRD